MRKLEYRRKNIRETNVKQKYKRDYYSTSPPIINWFSFFRNCWMIYYINHSTGSSNCNFISRNGVWNYLIRNAISEPASSIHTKAKCVVCNMEPNVLSHCLSSNPSYFFHRSTNLNLKVVLFIRRKVHQATPRVNSVKTAIVCMNAFHHATWCWYCLISTVVRRSQHPRFNKPIFQSNTTAAV